MPTTFSREDQDLADSYDEVMQKSFQDTRPDTPQAEPEPTQVEPETPQAPPAETPGTPQAEVDQPPAASNKDDPPTLERAKVQYAKVHGGAASDVTETMLEQSELGIEGWACAGLDCNARGPLGNALYRSFKKNPQAAESYRWLFDDLKKKFTQSWAMSRNFEFIEHKRVHVISTTTRQEEIGQWKNQLQLEQHYGGVGIPEAKRQADNYISNCRKFEEKSC